MNFTVTVFHKRLCYCLVYLFKGGDGKVSGETCGVGGRARLLTVRSGLAISATMAVFAGRPDALALLKVKA